MGGYGSGRRGHAPYTVEQVQQVTIEGARRRLGLCYPGDTSLPVWRQQIALDWTPCQFGGHRPWFVCPRCGRRVGALFGWGSDIGCRQCFGLPYESQREVPHHRAIRRERKIRLRLGGGPSVCDPIPWKPKGMHWRTYERLTARIRRASFEVTAGCNAFLQRMQADPKITVIIDRRKNRKR